MQIRREHLVLSALISAIAMPMASNASTTYFDWNLGSYGTFKWTQPSTDSAGFYQGVGNIFSTDATSWTLPAGAYKFDPTGAGDHVLYTIDGFNVIAIAIPEWTVPGYAFPTSGFAPPAGTAGHNVFSRVGTTVTFNPGVYDTSGGQFTPSGVLTVKNAVPEPATWSLMILGLGGLGAALRSRRRVSITQA